MPIPKVNIVDLLNGSLYSPYHEYGTRETGRQPYTIHKDFEEVTFNGVKLLKRIVHDLPKVNPSPWELTRWIFPDVTREESDKLFEELSGSKFNIHLVTKMTELLCQMRVTRPTEDIESYWEDHHPKPEPIKLEKPKLNPVFQAALDQSDADIRQMIIGQGLLVGPQGSQNPPEPPRGANGPSGSVSPLRDADPPRSPVRIASVTLPTILGYRAIDFQSEAEGFLANQPTQYASHPYLHARYIFDTFSGICVYGSVEIPTRSYLITGRRHGYGDVIAESINITLQQLMASPTINAAIYMIGRAWDETIHRLLQPTMAALEMGSPEAPPIPQGSENRRLRHG